MGLGPIIVTLGTGSEFSRSATTGLVCQNDRAGKPVERLIGGDSLKTPPPTYRKATSKERGNAPDLSAVRDLLRSAALLSLMVVATSIVIGANEAKPESIQDCLIIAGWLLMLVWAGTLLVVAVNSIAIITLWIFRRVGRATARRSQVGGVADNWLDGPT